MGFFFSMAHRSIRILLFIYTIFVLTLAIALRLVWHIDTWVILVALMPLAGLVVGFLFILHPIESVIKAAKNITDTHQFTYATPKYLFGLEIQRLVIDFNEMVSELKNQKSSLEASHGDLQNLVSDRTAELVHNNLELSLAKEKADSAARSKASFLNHMSSSLRTPLNGILIYADLLSGSLEAKDTSPDLLKKDLAKIQLAANQLLKDIDKIIDYAQVELGQSTLSLTEVSVSELLNELTSLSEQLSKKNLNQCDFRKHSRLPISITSDAEKLKYVLFSLIENAHKFTSRGIIQINIDPDKDFLIFTIADTGCGIHTDKLKTLFGGLTRSIHKGDATLGLSLTLAKKYTDLLGGSLTVKTEPNQGSVFTLKVPMNPTYSVSKSNINILVVSRSQWGSRLLPMLLNQGFWATLASTTHEAVSLAKSLHPQLVVFMVGSATSWDDLWDLQRLGELERSRFLIVGEHKDKFFVAEARKILHKPVAKDHLARVLASFSIERNNPYILIIEDDRVTALLINRHVESLGWRTQICTSAEDALHHLDTEPPPSLVLLDLMLPGMSGQVFAQELANRFLDIPIVVVTGRESLNGEDLSLLNTHEYSSMTDSEALTETCRMVRSFSTRKLRG